MPKSDLQTQSDTVEGSGDKVIGIIGGLGPLATADFFDRIIRNTPAKTDQDHLHILIDNYPKTPNRHDAIRGIGPSPAESLGRSALRLQSAGAEFLVMPCNTAHAFEKAITDAVNIPLISIITETCKYIHNHLGGLKMTGVFAADGCLESDLYNQGLSKIDVGSVYLLSKRQKDFMGLVHEIKSTGVTDKIRVNMISMTDELISQGAQAILARCTEVPLVLAPKDLGVPLIDSTEVLAKRCVQIAKGFDT